MARSKERSKRKRSSGSRDSSHYAKGHIANNTAKRVCSLPKEENSTPSTSSTSTQNQLFCDVTSQAQIPYYSWTTYFFNQEYDENSVVVANIKALIDFFERNTSDSQIYHPDMVLNLDINQIAGDFTIFAQWPSLMTGLSRLPLLTFSCISTAFFEVCLRRLMAYQILDFTKIFRILRLTRIDITNHESINTVPSFNMSSYGKLTSISGNVINTGVPKRSSALVVLGCTCGREIITKQEHGKYVAPNRCTVCGSGKFSPLLNSVHQFTKVEQTIQIKECPTVQKIDEGASTPNIVNVKLTGSATDKFVPGDKIRVIGIPRVTLGAVKTTTQGSCPLHLDAISTYGIDDENCGLVTEDSANIPIDRNIIERIQSEPDVFGLLIKSLCPNVHGQEIIKAALILGMVSGGPGCSETRDYLHTLIVGDLGLGKSQLLRTCAQIDPKGTYIRGSSATSLEPSMINVREAGVEDSRLEAGALSLASNGTCYIDELDKITTQHQAIIACMEDRQVTFTNSEMKMDFEARTAIVGMISPLKKRYDLSKTIVENVNASQEFLSRFDLIFIMRDHPDKYRDRLMCDRMLNMHTKRSQLSDRTQFSGSSIASGSRAKDSRTIMERLSTPDESNSDILPQSLLRMYINYARTYAKPEISRDAMVAIEAFYFRNFRDKRSVNAQRLVRTLIIMMQARAKIDLRAETTEEDVHDTLEIFELSRSIRPDMQQVYRPQASSSNNSNKLTANKVNQFLNDLRTEADFLGKTTFTTEEFRNIAGKENVSGHILFNLVSKLNEQGYILKVSPNKYKLVSM